MTSGTITTATIFVWMLNLMMVFSQLAITDMTTHLQTTGPQYINCSGTIIKAYSTGDCSSLSGPNSKNLTLELPTGATSGVFIVDWITSATSWIGKQMDTFTQVVNAPYNMLMMISLFQQEQYVAFAAIIGTMWWGISLLLLAAFIFGR